MAQKTYSAELKAKVLAEWMAGSSQNSLAKKYSVPRPTIIDWTRQHTRQVLIPEPDLREQFGRLVFETAMHTFEALNAHVRAAASPEFAGAVEGWTTRINELTKTAIALGAAIQRGSPEPITIDDSLSPRPHEGAPESG